MARNYDDELVDNMEKLIEQVTLDEKGFLEYLALMEAQKHTQIDMNQFKEDLNRIDEDQPMSDGANTAYMMNQYCMYKMAKNDVFTDRVKTAIDSFSLYAKKNLGYQMVEFNRDNSRDALASYVKAQSKQSWKQTHPDWEISEEVPVAPIAQLGYGENAKPVHSVKIYANPEQDQHIFTGDALKGELDYLKGFKKLLKDARTMTNDKTYYAVEQAIDVAALALKNTKKADDSDYMMALQNIENCVKAYYEHKANDGIRSNSFKKLAAVDQLGKFVVARRLEVMGKQADREDNVLTAHGTIGFSSSIAEGVQESLGFMSACETIRDIAKTKNIEMHDSLAGENKNAIVEKNAPGAQDIIAMM